MNRSWQESKMCEYECECVRGYSKKRDSKYLGEEARRKSPVEEARVSWMLLKHLDRDQKKEESQARLGQALLIFP